MAGQFPIKLGARISAGLLAAAYLWNLRIMLAKDVLHEAAWDPFEASLGSSKLRGQQRNASSTRDRDGHIVKSVKLTKLNITLPPPEERAPGFIIIGTQKGGTQALKTYLEQHPLIEMPTEYAEPHFFDWAWDKEKTPQENFNVYAKKYHDQDCRKRLCIAGESTPSYMYDTGHVPARVHEICPWIKLIVILRDPAKRAQSQHNMLVEKDEIGKSAKDFESHLQSELDWMKKVGLVSNTTLSHKEEDEAWIKYQDHRKWRKFMLGRGMYEIQLRAWLKYFPRDQFLILKSEDLDHDRAATMIRVYQFLGVPGQVLENDKKVHTRNYSTPISDEVQIFLHDFYRPYNRRLESLLGPEWKGVWERPSSLLEGTSAATDQQHQSKQRDGSATRLENPFSVNTARVKHHSNNTTLPPSGERAPGFMIIGAQKGGTQALRSYLEKHPHVVMPTTVAETHFFDKYWRFESPEESLRYYVRRYFNKDCGMNDTFCISGESTPVYLYDTKVPARVREACKWVKLIVVLRDPVKRAFSHYNMLHMKKEIHNATFEEHLDLDLKWMKEVALISNLSTSPLSQKEEDDAWLRYLTHERWRRLILGRGMYELQLRVWFKHFPRDQFLILRSDELQNNHTATMSRVYRFLGLAEHEVKEDLKKHVRHYSSPVSDELETFLYDFYRPYNRRLERLLGPDWKGVWDEAS